MRCKIADCCFAPICVFPVAAVSRSREWSSTMCLAGDGARPLAPQWRVAMIGHTAAAAAAGRTTAATVAVVISSSHDG